MVSVFHALSSSDFNNFRLSSDKVSVFHAFSSSDFNNFRLSSDKVSSFMLLLPTIFVSVVRLVQSKLSNNIHSFFRFVCVCQCGCLVNRACFIQLSSTVVISCCRLVCCGCWVVRVVAKQIAEKLLLGKRYVVGFTCIPPTCHTHCIPTEPETVTWAKPSYSTQFTRYILFVTFISTFSLVKAIRPIYLLLLCFFYTYVQFMIFTVPTYSIVTVPCVFY
jgi:hypothetical protein